MNRHFVVELPSTISGRFGKNKTEEIRRLLTEISRRESTDFNSVFQHIFSGIKQTPHDILFRDLKTILLRRRFPSLEPSDLKQVYLAPLPKPLSPVPSEISESAGRIFKPDAIYIEKRVWDFPLSKRIRAKWPDVPAGEIENVSDLKRAKHEWLGHFGKRCLAVTFERFDFKKPCPCSAKMLSCRYQLINLGYGCPYDCSYCFLQEYQNLPAIILPANLEDFLGKLSACFKAKRGHFARIGTGEFTDSLALDDVTEYSKTLVPFFSDRNVVLELKTKSDCIGNLKGLSHGDRTVIAWSVNPDRWAREERGAPKLANRLEAAGTCEKNGYGTAFHLDPVLALEDWEADYRKLIDEIFTHVHRSVRWFSLGTLRFHRNLRRTAESRHPESEIFLGEMRIDSADGKVRYPDVLRIEIYQKLIRHIRTHHAAVPVYLCMEPVSVWKAVFGKLPFGDGIDSWIASEGA